MAIKTKMIINRMIIFTIKKKNKIVMIMMAMYKIKEMTKYIMKKMKMILEMNNMMKMDIPTMMKENTAVTNMKTKMNITTMKMMT